MHFETADCTQTSALALPCQLYKPHLPWFEASTIRLAEIASLEGKIPCAPAEMEKRRKRSAGQSADNPAKSCSIHRLSTSPGAMMMARRWIMSQYVFHCQDCDKEFTLQQHPSDIEKTEIRCPNCNSKNVHQLVSAFSAVTAKKS
jgi:putative FmdB family regulatory protein